MDKFFLGVVTGVLVLSLGISIGIKRGSRPSSAKDWSPRLPWKDFMKEQGYEGEITQIYIKNGCLEVGTDEKIIHISIIETL